MRTILIVARSAPWRRALAARLEQEGFAVTIAGDAEEARVSLATALPGAALLDCDLPRRSARRLITQLERDPRLQGIRRLFVAPAQGPDAGLQSGPVFEKPLDVGHVVRALRALYPDPDRRLAVVPPRPTPDHLDLAIRTALAM